MTDDSRFYRANWAGGDRLGQANYAAHRPVELDSSALLGYANGDVFGVFLVDRRRLDPPLLASLGILLRNFAGRAAPLHVAAELGDRESCRDYRWGLQK